MNTELFWKRHFVKCTPFCNVQWKHTVMVCIWLGVYSTSHHMQVFIIVKRSGIFHFRFWKSTICVFDYWIRFVSKTSLQHKPSSAHSLDMASAPFWKLINKTYPTNETILSFFENSNIFLAEIHSYNMKLRKFLNFAFIVFSYKKRAHTSWVKSAQTQ